MLSNLAVGFARCGLDYESEYLCQGEDFKIRPVVYYTICEQHYCNGNQQPVSLKLGIMIGPTNRRN